MAESGQESSQSAPAGVLQTPARVRHVGHVGEFTSPRSESDDGDLADDSEGGHGSEHGHGLEVDGGDNCRAHPIGSLALILATFYINDARSYRHSPLPWLSMTAGRRRAGGHQGRACEDTAGGGSE